MSLEGALVTLITSDAGMSALISNRLYPDRLPIDPTLPAIAYQQVTLAETSAHGGDVGYEQIGMQFRIYANTRTAALAIRDALRDTLRDYRGVVDNEKIDRIRITNAISDFDPGNDDYQVIVDTVVHHVRSGG